MIPKVIFRNSWLYDGRLKHRDSDFVMPSSARIKSGVSYLEERWSKLGPEILRELAKVTHLKWQRKEVVCYVTAGVRPFSDPLTVSLRKVKKKMLHTLVHELIHCVLSDGDNSKVISKGWNMLMRKYKKESQGARTHIVIHAIHQHIYRKFFDEKEIEKEIRDIKHPDYIRAWEIVKRDGYKNIISELTKK